MIRPSVDHNTPEPLPRLPGCTKTVKRRTRSAISPSPRMLILRAPVRAFRNRDRNFPRCAATQKLHRDRLPDAFADQVDPNIFEPRNRLPVDGHKYVSNYHPGLVCRAAWLDLQHHRGGFFLAAERLSQILGEA